MNSIIKSLLGVSLLIFTSISCVDGKRITLPTSFQMTAMTTFVKPQNPVEIFASVPEAVGNISFTAKGALIYSHHPFFAPKIRVVSYNPETKTTSPFPNVAWNTPRDGDDQYLSNVLGIRNDKNGIVWMLDMAQRNPIKPKIVGWNTHTNQLEKIYYLDESVVEASQPNDMVVDTKHGYFIIADEGIGNGGDGTAGAFILVDMKTGKTRRVLEGTRTTKPENNPTVIRGDTLAVNGTPLLVGNDGITSDQNFEWIFYGPLNGSKMYRIKTLDLLNDTLSEEELDQRIETYAEKPNNGGVSIDIDGNLYLTALESNSVAVIDAKSKRLSMIVADEKMVWPDGVSYNHIDGYMYVSAAQVNLGAVFNEGMNKSTAPFYIFRFKPLSKGVDFR